MKKELKITQLTPVETALQKQFKTDASNLTDLVNKAYTSTAKLQGAHIASMVSFGLLALSIKPIIGHGNFGKWLEDSLGGKLSKSNAYNWIKAAEWLVAKIGNAEKQTDILSERICEFLDVCKIKGGAAEILSDAKCTSNFLVHVAQDLPFKTFLNILKTANTAAIEAEDAENNTQTALTKRDLKGLNDANAVNTQTDFFDDLFTEVRASVEVKRQDPRFLKMSKDELAELGNYLVRQGNEILTLANTTQR